MKDKFLEWEDKIFTAPYKWLVTKGYVAAKKIYLSMEDLYDCEGDLDGDGIDDETERKINY